MSQSNSGDWILSPSNDLTSDILRRGLSTLDAVLAGGPTERIAASLMKLISATRRPAWMDDEIADTYFQTVQEALHDYPVDTVERACMDWRKGPQGEWWPAEAELRRLCEKLFTSRRDLRNKTAHLLGMLEAEEEAETRRRERENNPSYFPGEAAGELKRRCKLKMTPRAFDCWFHAADIKYEGDVILVRAPIAADVFNRDWKADLKELGLTVRHDALAFVNEPPRRAEEATPAERTAFVAELRKLGVTLGGGK